MRLLRVNEAERAGDIGGMASVCGAVQGGRILRARRNMNGYLVHTVKISPDCVELRTQRHRSMKELMDQPEICSARLE